MDSYFHNFKNPTRNCTYIWVALQGHNSQKMMFLMDTGANISILPANLYDGTDNKFKTDLLPSDMNILAGNNTKCNTRGMCTMNLRIEGVNKEQLKFKQKFYICTDATTPILGCDFMGKNDGILMIERQRILLNMIDIPCFDSSEYLKTASVHAIKSTFIPPNTEAVIHARIHKGYHQMHKPCILQPTKSYLEKSGILVCKTLVTPEDTVVPVRVFNPTTEHLQIQKGSTLAISEPVTSFYRYTGIPKEEVTKCECICNCIPTPTSEPLALKLPCCHKIKKMTHTEKYNYMWLDEHQNTNLVYTQFEADPTVPDHVKELYMSGLIMLENVKQRNRLAQILSDYSDIFAKHSDDVGRTNVVKHTIETGDARPVHQRCRRLAKSHIDIIREQVTKLSGAGIIRPSNSDWAANCVVVSKKDNTKRMCIDYRGLNAVTVNPDSYLLPRIDDTLDALSGSKYFCTLDMIQGYHQVEFEEGSKHKTAFHAPYCNPSQWEYNYMPFGLVKAPRTFQRLMDRVIQGLEYEMALCYLDDIIVFAPTIGTVYGQTNYSIRPSTWRES